MKTTISCLSMIMENLLLKFSAIFSHETQYLLGTLKNGFAIFFTYVKGSVKDPLVHRCKFLT